jgi:hypothetical protein
MKCLTRASGDGVWGQLYDSYFLAEGNPKELKGAFFKLERNYGKAVFGERGKKLSPLTKKSIPPAVINALKHLPHAKEVKS